MGFWRNFHAFGINNWTFANYREESNVLPFAESSQTTSSGRGSKPRPRRPGTTERPVAAPAQPAPATLSTSQLKKSADEYLKAVKPLAGRFANASKAERQEISRELRDPGIEIQRLLWDCDAQTDEAAIARLLKASLYTLAPGLAAAWGQIPDNCVDLNAPTKLDGAVAQLVALRNRLNEVGHGTAFIEAFRHVVLFVDGSFGDDAPSERVLSMSAEEYALRRDRCYKRMEMRFAEFEAIVSAGLHGGELFACLFATRGNWHDILFSLRTQGEQAVGWRRELLSEYRPLNALYFNPDAGLAEKVHAGITSCLDELTTLKRKLGSLQNDLLRHAKIQHQVADTVLEKNLYGAGCSQPSFLPNFNKHASMKACMDDYDLLADRANHTWLAHANVELKLAEMLVAQSDRMADEEKRRAQSCHARICARRDAFKEACVYTISPAVEAALPLDANMDMKEREDVLDNLYGTGLISGTAFTSSVERMAQIAGQFLGKSTMNDNIVGAATPKLRERLTKPVNIAVTQQEFMDAITEDAVYLSAHDDILRKALPEQQAGDQPQEPGDNLAVSRKQAGDQPSNSDDELAVVRDIVRALKENPLQFCQDDPAGADNAWRIDSMWQSVIMRAALAEWRAGGKVDFDETFKERLCKRLDEIGCDSKIRRRIDFNSIYKYVTREKFSDDEYRRFTDETSRKLHDFETTLNDAAQLEPAAEQLLDTLLALDPMSFLYLSQSEVKRLTVSAGALVASGSATVERYRKINEIWVTRLDDGFRIYSYTGKGTKDALSAGPSAAGLLTAGVEGSGGYRTYSGDGITLKLSDFGGNDHSLCRAAIALISGKQADGKPLDAEFFMRHAKNHESFGVKHVDGTFGAYAGVGPSESGGIGVVGWQAEAQLKARVPITSFKKSRSYVSKNDNHEASLLQFKLEGEIGFQAKAGFVAGTPETHLPVPVYGKGVGAKQSHLVYLWRGNTFDRFNNTFKGGYFGLACFIESMAKMSTEKREDTIFLKLQYLLSASPKARERLERGEFDQYIINLAKDIVKEKDSNVMIDVEFSPSPELTLRLNTIADYISNLREQGADSEDVKSQIAAYEEEQKKLCDDPDNYEPRLAWFVHLNEGSGRKSTPARIGLKIADVGAVVEKSHDSTNWIEVQKTAKARLMFPHQAPQMTPGRFNRDHAAKLNEMSNMGQLA
jgi:hypothetical protein